MFNNGSCVFCNRSKENGDLKCFNCGKLFNSKYPQSVIDKIKSEYNPNRIENGLDPLTDKVIQQCLDILDSTNTKERKYV